MQRMHNKFLLASLKYLFFYLRPSIVVKCSKNKRHWANRR